MWDRAKKEFINKQNLFKHILAGKKLSSCKAKEPKRKKWAADHHIYSSCIVARSVRFLTKIKWKFPTNDAFLHHLKKRILQYSLAWPKQQQKWKPYHIQQHLCHLQNDRRQKSDLWRKLFENLWLSFISTIRSHSHSWFDLSFC